MKEQILISKIHTIQKWDKRTDISRAIVKFYTIFFCYIWWSFQQAAGDT